jgi:hypothetical protein
VKYIYFDESGDLGLNLNKPAVSRFFYIVLIVCEDYRPISKVIKKAAKTIPPKRRKTFYGALHATEELPATVEKVLIELALNNLEIYALKIDKIKNAEKIMKERHDKLCIKFVGKLTRSIDFGKGADLRFILSKMFIKKSQNNDLIESVRRSASEAGSVNVEVLRPMDDKCLQAVDFIAWAINRKFEMNDAKMYNIIEEKVVKIYEM